MFEVSKVRVVHAGMSCEYIGYGNLANVPNSFVLSGSEFDTVLEVHGIQRWPYF